MFCVLLLFVCVWAVVDQLPRLGKVGAGLSAVICLWLCDFCSGRFLLPLGAWNGLRYFIVALPEPSIYLL